MFPWVQCLSYRPAFKIRWHLIFTVSLTSKCNAQRHECCFPLPEQKESDYLIFSRWGWEGIGRRGVISTVNILKLNNSFASLFSAHGVVRRLTTSWYPAAWAKLLMQFCLYYTTTWSFTGLTSLVWTRSRWQVFTKYYGSLACQFVHTGSWQLTYRLIR